MKTHRYTLALAAGLAIAATAQAAEVRGVIAQVDLDKKELVLEGRGRGLRGALLVFTLPDKAEVMFGDRPGALSDLEPGRRVRVQYEAADGRQVAEVIHVLGGPKPAAPAVAVTPAAPAIPPAGDALTGVLRHVGYSDRELVLVGPGPKGAEMETTVAVPESARIVKDGKEATLDDLKEGDSATVQVEKKDGRTVALSVQVGAGAATAQADKTRSKAISKIRILLKVADQVLQQMENRDRDRQP